MVESIALKIISDISMIYAVIIGAIVIGFLIKRNIKEYKDEKVVNKTRTLVILLLISDFLLRFLNLLYFTFEALDFDESLMSSSLFTFSFPLLIKGLMTVFGVTFVVVLFDKYYLVSVPVLLFIGTLLLYYLTGNFLFFLIFVIGGSAIGQAAIFYAGIKLKDSSCLGVVILFAILLIADTLNIPLLIPIALVLAYTCAVLLIFGKIKIFKVVGDD